MYLNNNNNMKYYINSPLEQFEIRDLLGLTSPMMDFSFINITNFGLYTMITLLVILTMNLMTNNYNKLVGSNWYLSQEMIYDTIMNMVKTQIGGKVWGYYFPLVYTFFITIFTMNLISMIPYSFAMTSHVVFVVSMSMIIWLGTTIIGFYTHGLKFFGLFLPTGTPLILVPLLVSIELLSYFARTISLGLRLSANIMAGHLLIVILGGLLFNLMAMNILTFLLGFLPMIAILGIVCLEFAITIIQAYVWCILMSSYLKDTIYLH
ncbi:AMI006Wp (mitochondrion) [Eremothecium gossypii ATCC 10895]|uniref:ATP synthase subunit a n=1 Tax=Eremothecium gossypii (strain ATCC 10895 / CBS 109.51 / FGSC 9923 / NRRL Y-1056) TaxID=284811 RepID=ATP6_EREGS|nr:AMI006Wp [Eremothecium gossypii ATCC 10895]Q75G39.1 RecName: Full=ATP synthase subunit a; AltName: Full=F-ATPase protein 6; Flags: Precursor [Eremothecium gossypii ATCC 10895]AAS50173.1 AMI006Wp [Eremothecium gossypii ATCC 10895]